RRLRPIDPALTSVDQPQSLKFLEGLANLGDQGTTGHRNYDTVRDSPLQLLGDFVADTLRTLGLKWAHVHVDEAPVILYGYLTAKPVDIIIIAVDSNDLGLVDQGTEDFAQFKISRNEYVAAQPGAGCMRGNGVREVARGSTSYRIEPEFQGLGQ